MNLQNCETVSFLEYVSVGVGMSFLIIFGPVVFALLLYLLFYTSYYWITLLYMVWLIYDLDTRNTGARSYKPFRNLVFWKPFRTYFSMKVVKTTNLDPLRNYLFIVVPHGYLSIGALLSFGTNVSGVDELFPGVTFHFVAQSICFWFPIFRDVLVFSGTVSSSEESINRLLSSPNGGHATCLAVGGARELLYAYPGLYKTIIKRRKGFARLALKHGTPLVPVISFGETDLFEKTSKPNKRFLRWIVDMIHNIFGFYLVIAKGKFFLFPHKRNISVVVGRPMEVKQVHEPTSEQIEETKQKFIKCLEELFEEEKHKYVADSSNTFMEFL